ncbi:YhdP family protein [Thiohalobacter sp. IOR34]|uniref:YhdP family protein n=1 Tax=Thiohalobacter sp. IOR34 TaxID=3057176 RepID=UPI0025B03775|nr:YhdP family protein [Thiohalobacter sp. IOR34]WJW74874.1 YhdP family protein [Thiohalobacter sp. IOR34]
MLRRFLLFLWYSSAGLVIGLALLLSLARIAMPLLEGYKAQLEAWLHARSGLVVHIEQMDLGWRGMGPTLRLIGARLQGPEGEEALLEVGELEIGVDLWVLLRRQALVTTAIALKRAQLTLERRPDGRWGLAGLQPAARADPLGLLLQQPLVELEEVELRIQDRFGSLPESYFRQLRARLRNRGPRHQLNAEFDLPEGLGRHMTLAADLVAVRERPGGLRGRFYLGSEGLFLRHWLQPMQPRGLQAGGVLDIRLWGDIEDGALRRLRGQGRIELPELRDAREPLPLFAASRVQTDFDWRHEADGWMLDLDRLRLNWADHVWPDSHAALRYRVLGKDRFGLQLSAGYLEIAPLRPLIARLLPLTAEQRAMLDGLRPRGALHGLKLAFEQAEGRPEGLLFRTAFQGVAVDAWESLPGVQGLSGLLEGGPERGRLVLDSRGVGLDMPRLFPGPLRIETLRGALDWRRYADRLRLDSPSLELATADLSTLSRLRIDLPGDGGPPWLDLQTAVLHGEVGAVGRYLPARVMSPRAVAWLNRALVGGEISSGGLIFFGRPTDFPFRQGQGRMEVRLNVADGVLDYRPEWHRIEAIEAEVAFLDDRMAIDAVSAKILDVDLSRVQVGIEHLGRSRLQAEGHAQGPLASMLRFVRESPLADRGYPLAELEGRGAAALDIRLDIPLRKSHGQHLGVDGRLRLDGNRLAFRRWELALDDLKGRLHFTERGLRAEAIEGRLWETPVRLAIDERQLEGAPFTRVELQGRLPLVERLRQQPLPLWRHLAGRADWRVQVDVHPAAAGRPAVNRLSLASDLRGIGVDLPAPLGKVAEAARGFRLDTVLEDHSPGPLRISYGPHSAALRLADGEGPLRIERGRLLFNAGPAALPEKPVLYLGGRLARFDLDEWRPLLGGDSTGGSPFAELRRVQLEIAELELFGRRFREQGIQARREATGWQVTLEGADAAGSLFLPQPLQGGTLRLDMQRLSLRRAEAAAAQADKVVPDELPALEAEIRHFVYQDHDLGEVRVRTRPIPQGMQVEQMEIRADWIQLQASGQWTRVAGEDASRFKVRLTAEDLGRLLENIGFGDGIQGGRTEAEISANWPGAPTEFSLPAMEGTLDIRIGKGYLTKLEPGAGRIFGLLSLQAIPRRLTLDFGDLFKKGFAFDSIEGHFTIIDSDAYTNDLTIEGPSARIEISGRTGLAARDYDQLVTVVPHVRSGLPIAGALAGGPAVGAALFLADRLLGRQLEGLARYQYTVTGSWDDPRFVRLEADGAESPPSPPGPR